MYLYLLTNTARQPQKSYVGITSRAAKRRLWEHFSESRYRLTLLARALRKYGRDAFTLTVLDEAESWEELCAMEQAAIVHYNTLQPHGYNLTRGGDGTLGYGNKGRTYTEEERIAHQVVWDAMQGHAVSEDTRAKISAKTLEQFASQGNPMLGRKHSAETKAKIAAKRRGRPGWNKGKKTGPMSEETKAKQSLAHKGQAAWNKGIPWREIVGGKEHPKARAVEYNGIVYASVMECHAKTGLARNTIKNHIKQGKAKYMAENTILTTRMAGMLGDPSMAEASPPAASAAFPGYYFHPTLPMVLCENEAEARALPPGYKNTPYTEAEADAWSAAQAKGEDKADDDEPHPRRSHR